MQPEPNETSQTNSLPKSSQSTNQDSQYGFHEPDEHISRQRHAGQGRAKPQRSASNTSSSASSTTRSSNDARERPLRRLSPPPRQKSRSPVDRIVEHEKDLSYIANRRVESRTFTIVQRGKHLGSPRVAIDDFPNGSYTTFAPCHNNSCLYRSLDSCTISSPSFIIIRGLACITTVPSIGDDTPRLEDSFLTLLPWSRGIEHIGHNVGDFGR